jgi:hypothetical protein
MSGVHPARADRRRGVVATRLQAENMARWLKGGSDTLSGGWAGQVTLRPMADNVTARPRATLLLTRPRAASERFAAEIAARACHSTS